MSDQFFQPGASGEAAWAAQQAAQTFGQEHVQAQLREVEQRGANERSVAERAQQLAGEAAAYRERGYYESTRAPSAPNYSSPSTSTPAAPVGAPVPTSYTNGVPTYDSGSGTPVGTKRGRSSTPKPQKRGDTFKLRMWALGVLVAGIVCFLIASNLDRHSSGGSGASALLVLIAFLLVFLAMCMGVLSLWGD